MCRVVPLIMRAKKELLMMLLFRMFDLETTRKDSCGSGGNPKENETFSIAPIAAGYHVARIAGGWV